MRCVALALAAFAVATLVALAAGAGLGTAFTVGELAFVPALMACWLWPWPPDRRSKPGEAAVSDPRRGAPAARRRARGRRAR